MSAKDGKDSVKDKENTATEVSKEATLGTKREGKTEGDATKEATASAEPTNTNRQPKGPQVDQIVMIFPGSDPTPNNNWQNAKLSEKSAKDQGPKDNSKTDKKTEATLKSAKSKEPVSQTEEAKTEIDKKKEEPSNPPPPPPPPPQQIVVKIEQPKTQPTSSDPPKSDPPPTPKKKKCCPLWCC